MSDEFDGLDSIPAGLQVKSVTKKVNTKGEASYTYVYERKPDFVNHTVQQTRKKLLKRSCAVNLHGTSATARKQPLTPEFIESSSSSSSAASTVGSEHSSTSTTRESVHSSASTRPRSALAAVAPLAPPSVSSSDATIIVRHPTRDEQSNIFRCMKGLPDREPRKRRGGIGARQRREQVRLEQGLIPKK